MAFTPTLFSKASLFSYRRTFCIQLASAFHEFQPNKKWRQPVASVLKLGGVKISKDEIVRDDPTNNVPDSIFSKLGMQLHRRDQHPLGILKNAIYDYFDTNYPNKFDKFDDLCPIVSTIAVDIRLFWSNDERFTFQFSKGQLGIKFKPFSKYPPCYKDMSFWINDSFTENNLCEVVRGIAGDLVEEVKLIDNFTNKKGMTSHCYRIAYRSMERSLTDEEINDLQWRVREQVETKLLVVLR
ncbi:unnamed protein product [Fraxinus pennsylvanica]|uniref:phenylalanine--tRNA ligase n=1 Tax=Fraxinus pennsylvanica TaxID=56036 RepID=A0AAD2AB93_9LAMI|nr:unnamed protein product [Fraxinus pennsylvanica]